MYTGCQGGKKENAGEQGQLLSGAAGVSTELHQDGSRQAQGRKYGVYIPVIIGVRETENQDRYQDPQRQAQDSRERPFAETTFHRRLPLNRRVAVPHQQGEQNGERYRSQHYQDGAAVQQVVQKEEIVRIRTF